MPRIDCRLSDVMVGSDRRDDSAGITSKLLDEILTYAYIPKEVVHAYRVQPLDKKASGRSK
jgi:hypothetical protein